MIHVWSWKRDKKFQSVVMVYDSRRVSHISDDQLQRTELLDVLSEVKTQVQDKIGSIDFPLPQFILIGKQSVGKSRLVESLAGEQFNFVSGTLGSRRPTVLEFRNDRSLSGSRWYVMDQKSRKWTNRPIMDVMHIIGEAHESLGANVTEEPVYVRLESPNCVDMQVVDLPGFRDFALDTEKQKLADKIEALVMRFMTDDRNVMLCVEESGDAANLATLTKCKRLDPTFSRTILIRNKLDKYYKDLTTENINEWLMGFGDLPDTLRKFCMTLPHWKDSEPPPMPFADLRKVMNEQDISELKSKGASEKYIPGIGFDNFARYMEQRIEVMFVGAIGPVLKKLRDMKSEAIQREKEIREEMDNTNPAQIASTVRDVGMSFSHSLNHVMEGFVRSDAGRVTLEDELRAFHEYHKALGSDQEILLLPSEDFSSLDEYVDYLRNDMKVPAFDVEVNGGAQFRRLMFEVEVFLRFSEIGVETTKKDVVQARGVSMGSLTWRDVVVKLLSNEAHIPMRKRVQYVAERIKYFFITQKDVILNFMLKIKGSADEQMFSTLYTKHVKLLLDNPTIKVLVFQTYDKAVDRQLAQFMELFNNTLASTFSNPWVFLKRASRGLEGDENGGDGTLDDVALPSFEDTKQRIPVEIESRSGMETVLTKWLAMIPQEPHQMDEAVDKVQMLVLKTFAFIRAQIADQIELFAESFFKLPMMRRLEEDMSLIELNPADYEVYKVRRDKLEDEYAEIKGNGESLEDCISRLSSFAIKAQSRIAKITSMNRA
jgi:GTP-binding protein EngB required for normal cell division